MPPQYGQGRLSPLEGQPVPTSSGGSAQAAEVVQRPPRHPGPISSARRRTPRSRSVGHSRQTQPASRSRPTMAGVPTPMSSASTSMRTAHPLQLCSSRRSRIQQTQRHLQERRRRVRRMAGILSTGTLRIQARPRISRATCTAQVSRLQGRRRHRQRVTSGQRWQPHQERQGQ